MMIGKVSKYIVFREPLVGEKR